MHLSLCRGRLQGISVGLSSGLYGDPYVCGQGCLSGGVLRGSMYVGESVCVCLCVSVPI